MGIRAITSLLFLLGVFITTAGLAQEPGDLDTRKDSKHLIGIKAGQNLSWLRLDPSVPQNVNTGPAFGVSYTFMAQYFAGLSLEALYIKYGWEEIFLDSANFYNRELTYLEFPVLSTFVIGKKKLHLKLEGGIKIAMLLNEVENSDVSDSALQYYNGRPVEDTFELGLAFGGALSHHLLFGEIQVGARYNTALSNLFKSTPDLSLIYSQNQGLTLTLTYLIKLK